MGEEMEEESHSLTVGNEDFGYNFSEFSFWDCPCHWQCRSPESGQTQRGAYRRTRTSAAREGCRETYFGLFHELYQLGETAAIFIARNAIYFIHNQHQIFLRG